MTIGPADVRRIAALAELDVPETEVARLAEQLDRIVGYAAQLSRLVGGGDSAYLPGPAAAPLRPDEVRAAALDRPLSDLGAKMRDGFFLVPRLPAMEDE